MPADGVCIQRYVDTSCHIAVLGPDPLSDPVVGSYQLPRETCGADQWNRSWHDFIDPLHWLLFLQDRIFLVHLFYLFGCRCNGSVLYVCLPEKEVHLDNSHVVALALTSSLLADWAHSSTMVMAFNPPARIWGECSTIHSSPVLFFLSLSLSL